ncbi:hypothetical protein [Streptomyces hirsutus]|uniref:hypothetical protein n=1 Tax=Streptomyces hirsutus TaxID=35620 RepID=UPI000A6C7AF5|nr:hypothetical protein [Streptomyces hirsutus]
MDSTQATLVSPAPSKAMLVTSIGLGSGDIGFAAGAFGRIVGDLTLYAATVTGVSTAAGAFVIGLGIASFLRKGSTQ